MDLKERLENKLIKMKAEVEKCYKIVNHHLDNDSVMFYHWRSRANAFRDCIDIIEECIKETN